MTRFFLAFALFTASVTGTAAHAQEEGPTPTQALVSFDPLHDEGVAFYRLLLSANVAARRVWHVRSSLWSGCTPPASARASRSCR